MPSRLSSTWLTRAVVATAVFAFPMFAVGSAQAAIAGANPSLTTSRPDVRSATPLDKTDVQVCFDKALAPTSAVFTNAPLMQLPAYTSGSSVLTPLSATPDATNSQCVNLAFNSLGGSLDLNQFTVVTVAPGAVTGASTTGGLTNLADSVTLSISPSTANGIVGHTTAPDLVGSANGSTNTVANTATIVYTFDQNVDPTHVSQTGFFYEGADGTLCFSTGALAGTGTTANTVTAVFPLNTCKAQPIPPAVVSTTFVNPTDARRVGVLASSVYSAVDGNATSTNANGTTGNETPNALQGQSSPTSAGTTILPDLQSATLSADGNSVSYTFDRQLNSGTPAVARNFYVVLSNGDVVNGTSASTTSSTTITVTFAANPAGPGAVPPFNSGGLSNYNEYAVQAGVTGNAVTAVGSPTATSQFPPPQLVLTPTTISDSPGSTAIGDNVGAVARGFTTGPDVYNVAINTTTNVVTVFFDQRVDDAAGNLAVCAGVKLLNAAGSVIGGPSSSCSIPAFPTAGPEAVTFSIDPSVTAQNPTQTAIDATCVFKSRLGTDGSANGRVDACAVAQIDRPTGVAAHLKAAKKAHKHHHRAHKHHRARRAHKR